MHASVIPSAVIERANHIMGAGHRTVIDPAKTAHIVVDLQVGFMAPNALVEVPVARDIVPQVNAIASAVRAAGAVNVFVRFTVDLNEPNYWAPMYDRMSEQARGAFVDAFSPGAEQHGLWSDLDVRPEDWIVDKTRFSAFIPGTCQLHERLQAHGIDTLIVTGTVTNCCCESTVRDAMQLGYKVLFIQDGNAALDDASHNATLANMVGLFFAEVCTADAAISRLNSAASVAA
jgi:nicotinamidase-related amidase